MNYLAWAKQKENTTSISLIRGIERKSQRSRPIRSKRGERDCREGCSQNLSCLPGPCSVGRKGCRWKFPKFWWLDKSQNSLRPYESGSPLPKGAIFLSANGCGVDQHTKAHAGLQAPSSSQVPVRHFRVHTSILALLTSPFPKLHLAPSSTHSLSC